MDPPDDPLAYKDAVFISPHKFIGGPGTPGVLVARRELFRNRVPSVPGGGTVPYVNPVEHVYLSDIEHREEGGTPAIVESIRAGLVFQLKAAVGVEAIREREDDFIRRAIARWAANPAIEILGSPDAERLSIVSFVVRHEGRYLHHNFVVALLNDLFGIQSRGGCSCAGPYGHRLLGIDLETLARVRARDRPRLRGHQARLGAGQLQLLHQRGGVRVHPRRGRPRRDATAGGCCPDYAFEPATGLWRHRGGPPRAAARACATSVRRRADGLRRRTATASRSRGWRTTSPRRAPCSRRPPPPLADAPTIDPARSGRTSRRCAGSGSPRRWRRAADRARA